MKHIKTSKIKKNKKLWLIYDTANPLTRSNLNIEFVSYAIFICEKSVKIRNVYFLISLLYFDKTISKLPRQFRTI